MTTTTATAATANGSTLDTSAMKLFSEMRGKTKAGNALTRDDTTNLINAMSDLHVSNGDINWLMGKVFKENGSPAIQNLFVQKLQERSTMAQTISSVWRTIFETMQTIARNIR